MKILPEINLQMSVSQFSGFTTLGIEYQQVQIEVHQNEEYVLGYLTSYGHFQLNVETSNEQLKLNYNIQF